MRDLSIRLFVAPLVVLALIAMSLVSAASVSAGTDQTGHITVDKRFCLAGDQQCNGRDDSFEDGTVAFNVTVGGTASETINVVIDQGNGSQGSTTSTVEYPVDTTVRVCEVVPAGYVSIPRPSDQGGQNQTTPAGLPCIDAVITSGNNVVQFNNEAVAQPTATATTAPTATATTAPTATTEPTATATTPPDATATATTPPDATATATTPPDATATGTTAPDATKAPDATATTTTVQVLPETGANASNGGWSLGLLVAGLAMVLGIASLSLRRRAS